MCDHLNIAHKYSVTFVQTSQTSEYNLRGACHTNSTQKSLCIIPSLQLITNFLALGKSTTEQDNNFLPTQANYGVLVRY